MSYGSGYSSLQSDLSQWVWGGLERIAFSPQLRLHPGGGYAGVGLARWQQRRGEWSQLPKAEVDLAVSLVLYGGGIFIAYTQHKQSV